ncbi:MAG TPA: response regulator transcription factor [Pantanalinema sp.]
MSEILIVEDEAHIANGLKFNLEIEGHAVTLVKDGMEAKRLLIDEQGAFDLIILDLMLPGMSGLDLCRGLRRSGNITPVLMLTARSQPLEKIEGLRIGADDYVTKPFNLEELLARVETLLRRASWQQASASGAPQTAFLEFGTARVDFERFEASRDGKVLKLTPIEFQLLRIFRDHPGKVLSREQLLEGAWGWSGPASTRTVDNFIMRLRRAFEADPAQPRHFLSVRGAGYKFVP